MLFYELISSADIEKCIEIYLGFCSDSPDIDTTRKSIEYTISVLQSSEYQKNDGMKIMVYEIPDLKDETIRYDAASIVDVKDGRRYGFEAVPWDKISGTKICDESLCHYEKERIAAVVLWEMTWFGFDEESVEENFRSLNKSYD